MLTPVGTAMLFRAFPPHERAKASAFLVVPTMVAPMLGPILGGWLIDYADWRWIFYINLPIGILGFLIAFFALQEHKEPTAGSFDLAGFVFSGAGLALVLYALSRAPEDGWTAPHVVTTGIAGVACFIALVWFELRRPLPMLDLRLLTDRMFRTANLVFFMSFAGLFGVLFLLPLYLQELRGLSALQSGLTTFPQALGMMLTIQVTSRLYSRVGPRRMMAAGMFIVTVSSAFFLLVGIDTSLWWIRLIMFGRGMGMAFAVVSNQAATFSTIKPKDTGRASSRFSTNRQVASAFGVALLATILIDRTATHIANAGSTATEAVSNATMLAYHDAFFAAVIFGLIGFGFSFLIHDEDAAASMRRPAADAAQREPAAAH
jgi:EmrB/QacA subfamily drug resistance transporter